jgi:tetratricopeptide (TPR) repeat protein
MDPTIIQQQLRDGIQAIRQGDLARGQALLLQVVADDDRNEGAWLWLSRAMPALADQLTALENVLALNPGNAEAHERAQALRRQLGLEPPPAPAAAESESTAPPAIDDALDNDPDQCPYCGKITEPEAGSCPYCRRSLLQAGRTDEAATYRWLVLLSAADLQFSILEPGLALARVVLQAGSAGAFVSSTLFYGMLGRILLWLAGFFFVVSSQAAAPMAALTVTLLDTAALGLGAALGWSPPQGAAVLAALDLPVLIVGGSMLLGRSQARLRQRVVLDRDAFGHAEMHRRGRRYARQGKWALAALHLQKAMVLRPAVRETYLDLSAAQAQLGRIPQALRTLRAAADRWPKDPEFPARIAALGQGEAPGRRS